MSKGKHQFAKFDGWVPVFAAGTQTDSKGVTKDWTEADLDQIVSNFDANDSAPIVIGHPKHNAPAWGWIDSLKRDGASLFAKFRDVSPKFLEWGKAGHIRNRSIKIQNSAKGYKIGHVGFLGAMQPAVEGMDAIEFGANDGETYEFGVGMENAWTLRSIARLFRSWRDHTIEKEGQEAADKVIPNWDIENLERQAVESESRTASDFNSSTEDDPMPFSQADLDAAVAAARAEEQAKTHAAEAKVRQSEFAARLADNKTFVSGLISDKEGKVRLLPAEADGWAEALTFSQELESQEFTFSAPDGSEQKPKLYEFLKAKLSGRTVQMQLGKEHITGEDRVDLNDAHAIEQAASEYMHEQAEKGVTINIAQAVDHVKQRGTR